MTETAGKTKTASAGETVVNENGLIAFSELEKANLSSGAKNKIITTFKDAVSFVRNALSNKQTVDRAYLGKLPDSVSRQIKVNTGVDVSSYTVFLNGNDVRHIMKDHGDPVVETARGQTAVTANDIALIPQVLASPDNVYLSSDEDGKGRAVLVFEKQIGDRYITMQGVSDGKHALETDTLYIRKQKDSQDTGHNAANGDPVINARSVPPQSPSSATTVSQSWEAVNTETEDGSIQQRYPNTANKAANAEKWKLRSGITRAMATIEQLQGREQTKLESEKRKAAEAMLEIYRQEYVKRYGEEYVPLAQGATAPMAGEDTLPTAEYAILTDEELADLDKN